MTKRIKQPPLPHVLQLRLDDELRKYVMFLAARDDIGMAEAVRMLLRRSLDHAPRVYAEGEAELPEHIRGRGTSLRAILSMVTEDGVAELAGQVRDDD